MLRAVYLSSVLLLTIFVSIFAVDPPINRDTVRKQKLQDKYDTSAQRAAAKIIHLMREVIMDMQRKMEAHYIIKHKWQNHRRFQIAEVVFDIRKKGSIIKSILKQNLMWDDVKQEYLVKNRTEDPKKDFLAIKDMTRCQYESIEIDKLVHSLERYQWGRLNSTQIYKKFRLTLRTNPETEKENKKSILRKQMKIINNKQEGSLSKLVEKLEDIPEENLKELLKKIGDVPQKRTKNTGDVAQKRTKNIGDIRQEGFKYIKKMAESKKTSDDPKHTGDGLEEDDDEAWK